MKTKLEIIAELKIKHPTIKVGDDEQGYTDLSADNYKATIELWADNVLADEAKAEAILAAKAAAQTKLAALGLTTDDLAALGL